jgi:nitrite reductase/ring-hydroxylating ferredoxin subunit
VDETAERWLSVPADVLAGDRAVVDGDGRQILLLRVAGEIHAFDNACPHEGNPLVDGDVLGDQLECAYHGWRFDLRTGACLYGDDAARRFETAVRGDEILIRID